RGDLREDVDAVAVLLNHPLDPANLTLDPAKPNEQPILVVVIANHRDLLGSRRAYPHGVSQAPRSVSRTRDRTRRSSRDFDVRRRSATDRAARIVAGLRMCPVDGLRLLRRWVHPVQGM